MILHEINSPEVRLRENLISIARATLDIPYINKLVLIIYLIKNSVSANSSSSNIFFAPDLFNIAGIRIFLQLAQGSCDMILILFRETLKIFCRAFCYMYLPSHAPVFLAL